MKDFFERFARGRTLKEPTLVSLTFAERMVLLFGKEGLFIDDERLCLQKLRVKMEEGVFDP
jgi:hypothetical protein